MVTPAATFELVLSGDPTPHRFTAFVPDGQGGKVAEHTFEWRTDSTALAMDLGSLARAAVSGQPPENNLHITFGRQLHTAVFAGAVGQLWDARLKEAHTHRQPLRLVLRVDPQTARSLLNLPWEYLHDGDDFLALNWRTPLSRLPWGLPASSLPLLGEPLRLLVVIAAPLGLSENMVLNNAREEDLILSATSAARRAGKMEVEFTPNGSPEALDAALREIDPHILHFTGHGVFITAQDTGVLLMEQTDGREREVPNAEFANLLERRAKSLRLIFLSACQSAVAARNEGYADLAPRLLEAGIPAVVAMQFSVFNKSAMEFGSTFYKGLADGDAVDAALTEARGLLARESLNRVDFVVPTLFLSDPHCLQVDDVAFRVGTRTRASLDLTGVATAQNFVGRSAELRELQTNLDPERGRWRAAIVYGLGGMGKTVLAARLAERMAGRLDGVKSLRMTPTTTARDVLDQLSAFLLVNQVRFNYAGMASHISDFNHIKDQPLPLENKVAIAAEMLRGLRLLLIFDNCEDILPDGQVVSRATLVQSAEARSSADPDLLKLFTLLLESVSGPTRFLFTSRVDFNLLEKGRLTDAVGHVGLSEMGFRDAVYLMETLSPLDRLPVATAVESSRDMPPAPQALSMRDIRERLGGHPYTLNLFAEHARRSTVESVLHDLQGVRKELLEVTLLDRAAAQLPELGGQLLRSAAVYDEPVPVEALAYIIGDDRDVMPDVGIEVQALLSWGLMARPPGSDHFIVHTLVRDWARAQWDAEERVELLRRAAGYWLAVGRESTSLEPELNARHYLFVAGEYRQAWEIVGWVWTYLLRWGQMELVLRLLSESVCTLEGESCAVARGNLARVYQALGDYDNARKGHEAVLEEFRAAGNRRNEAVCLNELGTLHQAQGEYERAREQYEQALAILQELGDCAGVATSLHNLGALHQLQGEYERATERYEQSLVMAQEVGNRVGMARSLHNLGALHQDQGEYERARELYEQSLAILQELGDRADVAGSLHNLGNLYYLQGKYERATERYEQSLAIAQEVGNSDNVARSLHQLGMLHQDQGEYQRARENYEQSLAILQELGDRDGVASALHQLGTLHHLQGEYERAREYYEQSLVMAQELGNRVGVARSLGQIGLLLEEEGNFTAALPALAQAFLIFRQLGSLEQQTVGGWLADLREKMGEQAFTEALEAVESAGEPTPSGTKVEGTTVEQVIHVVVENTVAVLTDSPEQKQEWLEALGAWQVGLHEQGLESLAVFLGIVQQLVDGIDPPRLTPQIPAEFHDVWDNLLRAIMRKEI